MSNVPRDIKKSQFTQETVIPAGTTFDFVYNGTNYKISAADMIAAFGLIGTIVQTGDPTQTPVLNKNGTENQIRNLEDGSGVKASVSPLGGITLEHNLQQDLTGVQIIKDITELSPTVRTLVAGSGISIGAQNGQIQIATTVTPASTKTIIINEFADFPAPISSVITLAADTQYLVVNDVSLGTNRLVFSANTVLSASSDYLITLTYTGSGTMITAANVAFRVEDIRLACPSAQLMDVSCSTNTSTVQFIDCTVTECDSIGTATGLLILNFEKMSFLDIKTNGLLLTGYNVVFRIESSDAVLNGGTLVDLGTSTAFAIAIGTSLITTAASTTVLSGLADSGNIVTGGLGTVFNVRAIGSGTALSGIDYTDTDWEFLLNSSVPNSRNSILGTNAGATVVIAATDTPVIVGATWISDLESRFEGTAGGRFTYLGKGAHVSINIAITATSASVSSKDYTFYLFKNGVEITGSAASRGLSSSSPGNISMVWQEDLATNDYLELFVENNDDTSNVTINNCVLGING